MKNVLIIGGGGWGREILQQMTGDDPAHGVHWNVTGILDSRAELAEKYDLGVPILGDPATYQPQSNDVFVCAVGDPRQRFQFAKPLLEKGGYFMPVLTLSRLAKRVSFGDGCFFSFGVNIAPDVKIGAFTHIQAMTMVGHDVRIGDYVHIGAQGFLGGGVEIEDFAVLHPRATVLPGIKIGKDAVVGAGSVVMKDVPAGATVFGNPARVIFEKPSN